MLRYFVATLICSLGFCGSVTSLDHPLIQHKLTLMQKKTTSVNEFQQLMSDVGMALCYEMTRALPQTHVKIETPLHKMDAPTIDGEKLCLISIMRDADDFLDGMKNFIPLATVGHVGTYRDHEALKPVRYYFRMPKDLSERDVIVIDTMLATAGSTIAAIDMIKEIGPRSIKLGALVATPEGLEKLKAAHPDVPIFVCAIDEKFNEIDYILPGFGDAGVRTYGTK